MHEIGWLQIAFAMVIALYLFVPLVLTVLVIIRLLRIWKRKKILLGFGGIFFPWDEVNYHRHQAEGQLSSLFSQSQEHAELFSLTDSHSDSLV